MKVIVYCIIGTLLVICFARPRQLAEMFNPNNRLTFDQAQECVKVLTGSYPNCVPIIVVGSSRDSASAQLEAALAQRGLAFTPVDIMLNPQARLVMNQFGKQSVPTTIVGTYLVSGCDPDAIEKDLLLEQKSLKWPVATAVSDSKVKTRGTPGAKHSSKVSKHGGEHGRSSVTRGSN